MYHCRERDHGLLGRMAVTQAVPDSTRSSKGRGRAMLDLGTSFLASVARDPGALAMVDGDVRLSYSAWYKLISALVASFDETGLAPSDHLVTLLQNRWE